MHRRQLLTSAAVAAAAAAAPTIAHADQSDHTIVGSWFGTVTATNPPLGSFTSLISFQEGGVVNESRRYLVKGTPFGDLLETTGHGAWEKRSGRRRFEAFFRFLIQNHDTGEPIGTDNIRLSLRLSQDGETLSGTFVSQIKLESGAVVFEAAGDYSATRITV
jgi:hypothetical protein